MSLQFEDLDVFQEARLLTKEIYQASKGGPFYSDKSLVDQIRRASISILSNIAEGFERNSNPEFIKFLGYAKGSCGEVRAQLYAALDQNYLNESEFLSLKDRCIRISKQIAGFQKYLRSKS